MNDNKEYFVEVLGGAFNKDANPSIEKDLGIKEGCYYFKTEDAKNRFCKLLENPIYVKQGLVIHVEYGEMTHKRTIFVGKIKYKDKEFIIEHDFGYEYPADTAEYMFTEGNYSCSCNLSLFIRGQYGEDAIPELECCDDDIEIVDYHIEFRD